jgi:hypothetical protein
MNDFSSFASPILNRISGNPYVTIDDLRVMHIKSGPVHDATPSHSKVQALDMPYFTITPVGGGDVKVRVRPTKDAKRSSKLKGFNIEFACAFLPLDEPRHLQIPDLTDHIVSTKAIFMKHCGTDKQSKYIFAACRWVNISDPSRNSPWSGILYVVVA